MSVEVIDGLFPASFWAEAFGDKLVETAISDGALDWSWSKHQWGVVFEVLFEDEEAWKRFQSSLIVRTALESVPDPTTGVIVFRGRGWNSDSPIPRRPHPLIGSGAAALPLPSPIHDIFNTEAPFEPRWLTTSN